MNGGYAFVIHHYKRDRPIFFYKHNNTNPSWLYFRILYIYILSFWRCYVWNKSSGMWFLWLSTQCLSMVNIRVIGIYICVTCCGAGGTIQVVRIGPLTTVLRWIIVMIFTTLPTSYSSFRYKYMLYRSLRHPLCVSFLSLSHSHLSSHSFLYEIHPPQG